MMALLPSGVMISMFIVFLSFCLESNTNGRHFGRFLARFLIRYVNVTFENLFEGSGVFLRFVKFSLGVSQKFLGALAR